MLVVVGAAAATLAEPREEARQLGGQWMVQEALAETLHRKPSSLLTQLTQPQQKLKTWTLSSLKGICSIKPSIHDWPEKDTTSHD